MVSAWMYRLRVVRVEGGMPHRSRLALLGYCVREIGLAPPLIVVLPGEIIKGVELRFWTATYHVEPSAPGAGNVSVAPRRDRYIVISLPSPTCVVYVSPPCGLTPAPNVPVHPWRRSHLLRLSLQHYLEYPAALDRLALH